MKSVTEDYPEFLFSTKHDLGSKNSNKEHFTSKSSYVILSSFAEIRRLLEHEIVCG